MQQLIKELIKLMKAVRYFLRIRKNQRPTHLTFNSYLIKI